LFYHGFSGYFDNFVKLIWQPLFSNLGLFGVILLGIGFIKSFLNNKTKTIVFVVTIIVWLFIMLPLRYDQMEEKILPIWFIFYIWLGIGVYYWFRFLFRRNILYRVFPFIGKHFMCGLLVLISLSPFVYIFRAYDNNQNKLMVTNRTKTDFRFCKYYGDDLLKQIEEYPKDTVLVTGWGSPLNYYLIVEKRRLDIKVFPGYAHTPSRINKLRKLYKDRLVVEKDIWINKRW